MRRKNKVIEYIMAKKYYLSLIGCLIITVIAVGIIYNKDQKYEEIANLNEVIPKEQGLVENPGDKDVFTIDETFDDLSEEQETSVHQENIPGVVIDNSTTEPIQEDTTQVATDVVPDEEEDGSLEEFVPVIEVQQPNLTFNIEQGMTKPLIGETIIPFSSIPVYFETLDQYKISQGEYIQAEVGMEVKAAAEGVVEKIEKQAVSGYLVTIYHGNGFKSVYGQLQEELNVKEGDLVYQGAIIGYIEKPTKYYSLEGSHLFFEVLENGNAIDPEPLFK